MSPVVLVILILNSLVFGAWLALGDSKVMADSFLVSWEALEAGPTGRCWGRRSRTSISCTSS
jgi:hypothetical protein